MSKESKEKTVSIYALKNPIDGRYFYVGATKLNPSIRYSQHMSEANSMVPVDYNKSHHRRVFFIQQLFHKGVMPEMEILEVVPFKLSEQKEIQYYNKLCLEGYDLIQNTYNFNYGSRDGLNKNYGAPERIIECFKIESPSGHFDSFYETYVTDNTFKHILFNDIKSLSVNSCAEIKITKVSISFEEYSKTRYLGSFVYYTGIKYKLL